ncbi:MAG: hypothetical protein FWE89_03090, partial [Syntrophaceae bacterium]|nr:hypothetical protein [Syntrophaceae bacterium]
MNSPMEQCIIPSKHGPQLRRRMQPPSRPGLAAKAYPVTAPCGHRGCFLPPVTARGAWAMDGFAIRHPARRAESKAGAMVMEDRKIPSQAQMKRWGTLTQEKSRRQQGRFLAEGEKVVAELLASGRPLETLLIREDRAAHLADLEERVPPTVGTYLLTARQWAVLSQDPSPEGIMAIAVTPPTPDPERLVNGPGPLLVLDRVGNPNNLGALLRTAHWFGFAAVLLGFGSCETVNPKVVRASMGSLFHLVVAEALDLEAL